MITTKGGWRKSGFIPWRGLSFEVRRGRRDRLEVLVNGELSAVIPAHVEEYDGWEVFGDVEREAALELERQRLQSFLEEIKSCWGVA